MTDGQVQHDGLCAEVQCKDRSSNRSRKGVVWRSYPYAESRSRRMQSTVTRTRFGRPSPDRLVEREVTSPSQQRPPAGLARAGIRDGAARGTS